MQVYLVGGAVRDRLLQLPVKDRDWVVVGATPEQLLAQGYEQVGADFPVFLHPDTHEEYALARTERKSGQGYQGFDCRFSPDITLEEDLLRRDLTINAMAMDEQQQLIDPYGGEQDLRHRILRHVSDAFAEDPLRVLRVARFAARLQPLGFTIAEETQALMHTMYTNGELEHLVAERVWQETQRALMDNHPPTYFQVLRDCGALGGWFAEIDRLFGVPQPEQHHPEIDCGIHAFMCLQAATEANASLAVRWAALTHDLGKALTPASEWPKHHGHEKRGLKPLKSLQRRLKVPNDVQQLAQLVTEFHTHVHRAQELRPETLLKLLQQTDAWRRPERFKEFLLACECDARGRTGFEQCEYPQRPYCEQALAVAQTVDAKDVITPGMQGAEIGQALQQARLQALKVWRAQA
ncbi:multifunctional CCA tRNA nucleotidyl transferase/2'3'-cyclic phosphodiesterase/2'nucleotidase/phosphatase [Bacterioplanes sanyensis]|uniref:Multifunctional CCA protein n=1 Tax=Bacterioplanes sanyensis TaxID=1249553 RepID=A0A222FP48_9GAMM|nr:multifunctional CCA addition/repair protein [Bacterioplanes sanyensis]ASP40787.1 multifunctional CCA tRNA nucleotidyl transferase/2'3'-cyclic phosphodiesterase/2'nucleotidase/phosphatase [Bacterioplanes sanyensis]